MNKTGQTKKLLKVLTSNDCCTSQLTDNWLLNGNSNTDVNNFLGTLNSVPLVLKTNSVERLRVLDTGNVGIGISNPSFKLDIGGVNTSDRKIGINNFQVVYYPDQALFTNSMFYGNGGQNLYHSSGFEGWNNLGVGLGALRDLTTGLNNTGVGVLALANNTSGFYNTGIGTAALQFNTTGEENTACGMNALGSNTVGNYNVAFGDSALLRNTTGNTNTAIGTFAMLNNTIGIQNTATGYRALNDNSFGNFNTASGYRAMQLSSLGSANVGIGAYALGSVTNSNYNTALGMYAGYAYTGTGDAYNVFVGYNTGLNIGTGVRNTILGSQITVPSGVNDSVYLGNGAGNIRLSFNDTGIMKFGVLPPEYADDVAAISGGLSTGDVYKTGSILKVVN